MKKTFIAIMMLAGWMQTACAQHTIESIRKAYQENWEVINMMSDNFPSDGIPPEYYHVHVAQNLPGTGGHQENVRYYYGELRGFPQDARNQTLLRRKKTVASASEGSYRLGVF